MHTAGRTVVFSALTVALALCGLLAFPMYFLKSFAYSGIPVVIFAALASLTVLPAALFGLGPRIDQLSMHRRPQKPVENGAWRKIADTIMRRPIALGVPAVVLLLALGAPFLHVKFGGPSASELPPGAPAARASVTLDQQYSAVSAEPVIVVSDNPGSRKTLNASVASYASELSRLSGVRQVEVVTGTYVQGRQFAPPTLASTRYETPGGIWMAVVPSVDPYGPAGQQLVRAIRATPRPFPVDVTGAGAQFLDTLTSIEHGMPLALLIIGISMFVLLFLLTGSVILPIKAFVLNMMSLSATFGAMVWVFQEGHLRWLVGNFTATNSVVVTMPILMFCIAFGLSMDYEVFLLSRISEEYADCSDNRLSVVRGLERTGRLVTAAAGLVAIVFFSFVSSGVTFMKMLGLGLGLAVLLDATIVRGVLVPAFMRLAGNMNWWAPRSLRRLHNRLGLREQ